MASTSYRLAQKLGDYSGGFRGPCPECWVRIPNLGAPAPLVKGDEFECTDSLAWTPQCRTAPLKLSTRKQLGPSLSHLCPCCSYANTVLSPLPFASKHKCSQLSRVQWGLIGSGYQFAWLRVDVQGDANCILKSPDATARSLTLVSRIPAEIWCKRVGIADKEMNFQHVKIPSNLQSSVLFDTRPPCFKRGIKSFGHIKYEMRGTWWSRNETEHKPLHGVNDEPTSCRRTRTHQLHA